ncbi:MAG: hypothetical protein KF727_06245 [Microbacteriaceae bacterium]|nr:hypothetical protein [Microbacteriaceae bacterium]
MNTTLTTHGRPTRDALPARRLGLVDRVALHLGIALIRWGRRPGRELARHERLANRHELALLARNHRAMLDAIEQDRNRERLAVARIH